MRAATESNDIRRDLVGLLPKLRRFALTLTPGAVEADHLVQDVCERAIAHTLVWNGQGRLEVCLYAVTRKLWIGEMSKQTAPAGDATPGANHPQRFGIDDDARGHDIRALVLSMPEGFASTFLLVAVEGHSYREAAEILEIPIGTVMSRLAAARLKLAAMTAGSREKRA